MIKPFRYLVLYLLQLCLLNASTLYAQDNCALNSSNQTVERCKNPLGIVSKQPRLGWQLTSNCSDSKQAYYQILVASSPQLLNTQQADMWNSGKVLSDQQLNVHYQGKTLKSAKRYYWKLKLWKKKDTEGTWSSLQHFSTGLIHQNEQVAQWIQADLGKDSTVDIARHAAHYFYHPIEWNLTKKVKTANCFVAGLGVYELYIDGIRIGQQHLNPASTDFDKRVLYNSYDISKILAGNQHAIGLVLGNGKLYSGRRHLKDYGLPRLWLQLHINFSDGTDTIIISHPKWYSSYDGAIEFNNEYDGERYNSAKEFKNWATYHQSVQNWARSKQMTNFEPILSPQRMPGPETIQTIVAQKVYKISQDTLIYDFGQNMAGWARLRIGGQQDRTIQLRYAEKIDSTGRLDSLSLRSAKAKDVFIQKKGTFIDYEPHFTYHGFRFVEISGLGIGTDSLELKAQVVHNKLDKKSDFRCSSPILNRIYSMIKWSLKSNYQQVPVDCPQREERLGWLGDRTASVYGEAYMYDIYQFYKKWLQDIKDAQAENGQIPNVVPAYWKMDKDNVTWPISYLHIVHLLSSHYGDQRIVNTHYRSMQKWLDYIDQNYSYKGYIFVDQYGDWLIPPKAVSDQKNNNPLLKSSAEILATTAFAKGLRLMIQFAQKTDQKNDVSRYQKRLELLKSALQTHLVDTTTQNYGTHSPTEIILLLNSELLPSEDQSKLLQNLSHLLEGPYAKRTPFGMVGLRYLFQTLSQQGRTDLAMNLLTNTQYPSWGYMLEQGATTLWEKWNGNPKSSQNHVILSADILHWFYAYLGGIRASKEALAFDKIDLLLQVPHQLDSLYVSFDSPRGTIVSHWKKNRNKVHWHLQIPLGIEATVYLPYSKKTARQMASFDLDTVCIKSSQKFAGYRLEAGNYRLEFPITSVAEIPPRSPMPFVSSIDTLLEEPSSTQYRLNLHSPDPKACIYYTLDGSIPNTKSKKYQGPLTLNKFSNLKAIAHSKNKKRSLMLQQAIHPYHPLLNGWHYKYYEINTRQLPRFDTLIAKDSGKIAHINLKKLKQRKHFWAFCFDSYVYIPQNGQYRFYLDSDDGSKCIIDNQVVVNNDGIHYSTQRQGKIYLQKGWHSIRLEHFNSWSFNSLELLISGPQLPKQVLPVSWLFYKKEG